jgi:hypothetical protein
MVQRSLHVSRPAVLSSMLASGMSTPLDCHDHRQRGALVPRMLLCITLLTACRLAPSLWQ